jgi:hypothetical protein
MARKPTKPPVQRKLRDARKDARGVRLTSDQRPFTILPSDFVKAFRVPPQAPKRGTKKLDPPEPTTTIPELNLIKLTPYAYETVVEAIYAADKVQIKKLNPKGGANLRFRIEIAAAFLAYVLQHAYKAGIDTDTDPKELMNLCLNLVIRRGQEIYGQDGA